MGYPLDCRVCGGYEYHKADCALRVSERAESERKHREDLVRIMRESASLAAHVHDRSRRERVATAVLQGILASGDRCGGYEMAAADALGFTDALIAKLSDEPKS